MLHTKEKLEKSKGNQSTVAYQEQIAALLDKMIGWTPFVRKQVKSARNWEKKGIESKALAQKLCKFVLEKFDSGGCVVEQCDVWLHFMFFIFCHVFMKAMLL